MSKTPRVIVSVTNDIYTDQRVHKVCTFLVKQGYDVLLVGRLRKNSQPLNERSYRTHRMKLFFDKGAKFYAEYNLRLFFFLLFRRTDILLANDLDTLLANYAASKFKVGAELVYDSHEYFTEVPELVGRKSVQGIWKGIEAWIFPKIRKIYTVNDSIAKLYSDKYKKKIRVVRNISPLWEPTNTLASKAELGLPDDKTIIILQGAGINVDRGAEEAVEAMQSVDNAILAIVGDGDVVPRLKERVKELKLEQRVLFFGKQPYDRMMNYTHHAQIGLTLDKDTNLNYKFSLPNKVFDYIHTNTAVVCTNLVEVANVVNTHEVGIVLQEFTEEYLANTLNLLIQDQERLERYQSNCNPAKEALNWEKECEVLEEIYPKVE